MLPSARPEKKSWAITEERRRSVSAARTRRSTERTGRGRWGRATKTDVQPTSVFSWRAPTAPGRRMTTAVARSTAPCRRQAPFASRPAGRNATLLRRHRNDLPLFPRHEDVVVLRERVVLLSRERPLVALDEPAVFAEVLERVADLGAVGRAGLVDGQGHQVHRVVGVGGADRRQDVLRALDPVLGLERRDHALADLTLLAEEAIGLHEHDRLGQLAGQLGEAPAADAPVRHGR